MTPQTSAGPLAPAPPVTETGTAPTSPATASGEAGAGTPREHGTLAAYKINDCKCGPCKAANRRYVANRNRLIAYGQWQPYADAEPVRAHVRRLQAAGLGWRRIGQLAGVPNGSMSKLIYGDPPRGMGPSKRLRPKTAAAILAIQPGLDVLAERVLVDATGTRRRVQALAVMGWAQARIADRLGVARSNFAKTMATSRVYAATARAVRAIYDELWDTPPPETTHREKIAASRARNLARSRGWAPPMAWDDERIDAPAATPDLGEQVSRERALYEDSEELIAQGHTTAQAAERLGIGRPYLDQVRSRIRRASQEAVA